MPRRPSLKWRLWPITDYRELRKSALPWSAKAPSSKSDHRGLRHSLPLAGFPLFLPCDPDTEGTPTSIGRNEPVPAIIVQSNGTTEQDTTVVLYEDVQPEHLASEHHAAQLIERVGWAVSDAKDAEDGGSE